MAMYVAGGLKNMSCHERYAPAGLALQPGGVIQAIADGRSLTRGPWSISFGISYRWEAQDVQTAKVFKTGRSQAIRLPKEFRVETTEVYLKRTPEGFLVIPRDPWEVFYEGVEELSADFMAGGRGQPAVQSRTWRP
jgi:antitoxin VapB